jgi:pyridoxine 4-dehydrogenase
MRTKDPSREFSIPLMMGTPVVEPPQSEQATQQVLVNPKTVQTPLRPSSIPWRRNVKSDKLTEAETVFVPAVKDPIDSPALRDRTMIGSLTVPNMGIGTIAWAARTDEDNMRLDQLAVHARQAGLTFFDTAERYGASPMAMIPASLAGLRAGGLLPHPTDADSGDPTYLGGDCESNLARWANGGTVATKFTPTPWRKSANDVVEAAKASAARLGVEKLDLYQIHMPDIIQPFKRFGIEEVKNEVYWDGLAECYLSGLCKNVGVSNYGPTLLAQAHAYLKERGVPLASNQIAFNLLTRRQGSQATVDAGNALGIKTLAYYPLAMGLLTGKLSGAGMRARTKDLWSDFRSQDLIRYIEGGKGGSAGDVPEGGITPLIVALEEVAVAHKKTAAQVALNWILKKGAVPLAGASSVTQIDENLGALGWRITSEEVIKLEEAADALSFDFNGAGFQTTDSKFVGYGFEKWRLD